MAANLSCVIASAVTRLSSEQYAGAADPMSCAEVIVGKLAKAKANMMRFLIVDCPRWSAPPSRRAIRAQWRTGPVRHSGNPKVTPALTSSTGRAFVIAWRTATSTATSSLTCQINPTSAGNRFELPEFLLVEDLGDWPHGPFRWTLDNGAHKDIAMVFARERRCCVQMDRSPIPTLRNDPGRARPKSRISDAVRQQHSKFRGDAWAGLVLEAARPDDTFQECARCRRGSRDRRGREGSAPDPRERLPILRSDRN